MSKKSKAQIDAEKTQAKALERLKQAEWDMNQNSLDRQAHEEAASAYANWVQAVFASNMAAVRS